MCVHVCTDPVVTSWHETPTATIAALHFDQVMIQGTLRYALKT